MGNEQNKKTVVRCGEMVRIYLEQNGFDGLVEKDARCACKLDDLMMVCDGEYAMECEAGHIIRYKEEGCPCGEGCEYHILAGHKNK